MADLLVILVSAIFVNNFVLARFLGICPFLGVSKKVETALGMGMAVTFVMTVATVVTWFVQYFVLIPFGIEYLQTIAFILVIASLVQLVSSQPSLPLLTSDEWCVSAALRSFLTPPVRNGWLQHQLRHKATYHADCVTDASR